MIGTIRKHSTWLWIAIIVVTIVSFVQWGSRSGSGREGRGRTNFGSIDGQRITEEEYQAAQREVYLRYFFTSGGQWPDLRDPRFDPARETYQWLFFLRKFQEYNIHVDDAAAAEGAKAMLRGSASGGPLALADVMQKIGSHATEQDFANYVRHQLAMQQFMAVIGLGGRLVTPEDAHALYVKLFQELSVQAVFFSASNYLSSVTGMTPAVIAQFYTNRMADYRILDRVQVSYVSFPITNKLAAVEKALTNLDDMVSQDFQSLGTNYARFGKTPNEAKAKIRELLILEKARNDTLGEVNAFMDTLLDMEPRRAENLNLLARSNNLPVHVTEPFDELNGPPGFDNGFSLAKEAFALTNTAPIAEQPIVGTNAVYVIALNRQIPSEIPPLDKVRDRVTADWRMSQATLLARSAGAAFVQSATNGLARGKTFAAVSAEAKVKPEAIAPFSRSTGTVPELNDRVSVPEFKEVAFNTPVGTVGGFNITADGGFAAYVQQQLPIDQVKMQANMPSFVAAIQRERQREAVDEWFQRAWPVALRDLPSMEPKGGAAPGQSEP